MLARRVRRDFEGTSLDTLRQMASDGNGNSLLTSTLCKSEIREENELRIADVKGVNVVRNHVLVWRNTSPDKSFFRELAMEIRKIVAQNLSDVVIPIKAMIGKDSSTSQL